MFKISLFWKYFLLNCISIKILKIFHLFSSICSTSLTYHCYLSAHLISVFTHLFEFSSIVNLENLISIFACGSYYHYQQQLRVTLPLPQEFPQSSFIIWQHLHMHSGYLAKSYLTNLQNAEYINE